MIGDLYFVQSSIRVARIEKNIDKDEIMDAIYNYSFYAYTSLKYLPRYYRIEQLDDTLYAIYLIAPADARPAYYFSTSNDEETEEKILHYDRSIRIL